MHIRRFTALILGCWIGLSAAMYFVATENFAGVDRMLTNHPANAELLLKRLPKPEQRMLLRYQASEANREYFNWFLIVQIGGGLLLLFNLLFATNGNKTLLSLAGAVLLLLLIQRFLLYPEVVHLGRLIDFVPPDAVSAERAKFWSAHKVFSGVEVGKSLLLLIILGRMLARGDTRRRPSRGDHLREEAIEVR